MLGVVVTVELVVPVVLLTVVVTVCWEFEFVVPVGVTVAPVLLVVTTEGDPADVVEPCVCTIWGVEVAVALPIVCTVEGVEVRAVVVTDGVATPNACNAKALWVADAPCKLPSRPIREA